MRKTKREPAALGERMVKGEYHNRLDSLKRAKKKGVKCEEQGKTVIQSTDMESVGGDVSNGISYLGLARRGTWYDGNDSLEWGGCVGGKDEAKKGGGGT